MKYLIEVKSGDDGMLAKQEIHFQDDGETMRGAQQRTAKQKVESLVGMMQKKWTRLGATVTYREMGES